MLHRRHELAVRHLVAGQLIGDDHPGHVPQALEQSAEELYDAGRAERRARDRAAPRLAGDGV